MSPPMLTIFVVYVTPFTLSARLPLLLALRALRPIPVRVAHPADVWPIVRALRARIEAHERN